MWIGTLTPEIVCDYLRQADLSVEPGELQLEARECRWVVHLPANQMIWFAMTEEGHRRLCTERKVLRLLEAKCSFAAPRVVYESHDGLFDVRTKVPGLVHPQAIFNRLRQDLELVAQTGAAIAQILVEQHAQITAQDVAGWLPETVGWPLSSGQIRQQVPQVVDDSVLINQIKKLLNQYDALLVPSNDRVLIHTDIGFHNLAFDPQTFEVLGIFDYDGAAWGDRHHDFRYLPFGKDVSAMLEAALAVYEPALDRRLSRRRIYLYNAVCAFSYLAYRMGTAPEENSCGRTLVQDMDWCRWVIATLKAMD
jgi:aminoglycoside phosphotransferase (APT) family kinase protein